MSVGSQGKFDEQYRLLIDKVSDGLVVTDMHGIVQFANLAAAMLLGREQRELLGRPIGLPLISADVAEIDPGRKDGKAAFAELRVAHIDWQGEPAYLLSLRDITLRRETATELLPHLKELIQSEQADRHQTRILKLILNSMTDGVVACDRDGRFVMINPAVQRLLGSTPVGIAPEMWAKHFGLFQKDGTTPEPVGESPLARAIRGESVEEVELPNHNQQHGEGRVVTETARPIWDSKGGLHGGVVFLRDITDRKHAETGLLKTEKLATAGRIAATIAHEINNPLAAAMNSVFLVLQDQSLSETSRQTLNGVERELKRIAHFTKQALGFYREPGQPTSVHVPELVDEILDLFASKLKDKSMCVVRRYHGVSRVQAIEGELRQIISNLVANSIDATSRNGTMHVRMSCPVQFNGAHPMMRLTIADSGKGICAEDLGRIFEPFFTTKESIGTGLGLWVTGELVRKYDGKIRVRSRLGKGSVFTVWIPTGHCE
jgi:PAS domain S-box-containing protein